MTTMSYKLLFLEEKLLLGLAPLQDIMFFPCGFCRQISCLVIADIWTLLEPFQANQSNNFEKANVI